MIKKLNNNSIISGRWNRYNKKKNKNKIYENKNKNMCVC